MMVKLHTPILARTESGFTIVELIIASSIFSFALLTIALGVTIFSNSYTKDVISSSTQDTVQNVTNSVEKAIRISNGSISTPLPATSTSAGVLCAGNEVFSFWLGYEQPSQISAFAPSNPYALYEEPIPSSGCPSTASYNSGGQSLLSDNERLLAFNVQPIAGTTDLYSVDVIVAYTAGGTGGNGNSLLCTPTISPSSSPGGCSGSAANISYSQLINNSSTITCKPGHQQQFCDISGLQSNVENRL